MLWTCVLVALQNVITLFIVLKYLYFSSVILIFKNNDSFTALF